VLEQRLRGPERTREVMGRYDRHSMLTVDQRMPYKQLKASGKLIQCFSAVDMMVKVLGYPVVCEIFSKVT